MVNIQETKDKPSESAEPLFQLLYISRVRYSELFNYNIFGNIAQSTIENNPTKGITTILCFGNGYFIQYIEGSEQALTNLKNTILKDRRHHSFKLCDFTEIKKRRFPNIYQGFIIIDKRHKFPQSGLRDYLPMTPYQWNLEKKNKLLDIIESNGLVQKDFQLSHYDMAVMRIKLLFQLAGDNFNHENRVFGLSMMFLLTCITVLVLMVLN